MRNITNFCKGFYRFKIFLLTIAVNIFIFFNLFSISNKASVAIPFSKISINTN